jgi:hypothetical protein
LKNRTANRHISKTQNQQNAKSANAKQSDSKQINSQNSQTAQQNSYIRKQQQKFSDPVTAWAALRPEASGSGILTA